MTKNFVSPVAKRIPFIGGLIDFALNVFVFKESIGKSAFKAIGAGLGAWILGAVGSVVPGAGTLLGGIVGGFAGDALGGLIYDMVFAKKSASDSKGDSRDLEKKGKVLGATATMGVAAAAASKPVRQAAKQGVKAVTRKGKALKNATKKVTQKVLKTGTKKATKSLGRNLLKTGTKKVIGSKLIKGASKGLTTIGKAALKGSKGVLKTAKKLISPIVKRIPFLGGLIDFLLNVFVFKEPLGKSAFMAVGAGLGAWIGGMIGTLIPVPFAGTAIGAFLGGAGGDMLGGAIYDAIFSGKEPQKQQKDDDKKSPTKITSKMDPEVAAKRLELEKLKRQYRRGTEERKNIESQIAELRSGNPISSNQNDYTGVDTYAGYEEEDSTTYVIKSTPKSPSASDGTDGNKTNETALQMTEGMMLASSLRESPSSVYAELYKR